MTAKSFLLSLPEKLNADIIGDKTTCFHFIIEGETKCTVRSTDKNLEGILNKSINPMMAVMTGKVKFDNQGELLKYAKLFGLM